MTASLTGHFTWVRDPRASKEKLAWLRKFAPHISADAIFRVRFPAFQPFSTTIPLWILKIPARGLAISVQPQDIIDAAEALVAEEIPVTLRSVRNRIGAGSCSTTLETIRLTCASHRG
ncbi:hypothetical protein Thiosp_00832 [Thiorhodovibrio litoralis]|nr:hypothetical protein Thiosp_00832 [Thiorhodovibrio litoralis]